MQYINKAAIICFILFFVVVGWHFSIFMIAMIKKLFKNNIKQGEDKDYEYRYAIIICAHNEENVIAQCIRSIHNMNYPKDKYKCFVVADNCTDKTIELAEKEGAIVIVKDDELPSTKGKALNYATRYISEKFYAQFDNICIIDSDNLVDKNFLKLINKNFLSGADVVSGNRKTRNPDASWISAVYSIYWNMLNHIYSKGHNGCNINSTISGTGFAFKIDVLENGIWKTNAFTEDIEFYVQTTLNDKKIAIESNALFYDMQPDKWSIMTRQLARWATGTQQVIKLYSKKAIKKFLKQPSLKNFDLMLTLLICKLVGGYVLFVVFLGVLTLIINFSVKSILWALGFLIIAYLIVTLIAAISIKMGKEPKKKKLRAAMCYPIFLVVLTAMNIKAMIVPEKEWKKIPH